MFPQKYLIAAGVLLAVLAWGGLGWYGKATAERDFAAYRAEQARLVTLQQEQIISERLKAEVKAKEASDAYQNGLRAADRRWADRLRHQPRAGAGAVPAAPIPPGGPDAAACEDRLHGALRQLDEVDRAARAVAQALRDAEHTAGQLKALQAFNCGR